MVLARVVKVKQDVGEGAVRLWVPVAGGVTCSLDVGSVNSSLFFWKCGLQQGTVGCGGEAQVLSLVLVERCSAWDEGVGQW